MTHTIVANNGAGTVTPTLIEGYNPSRKSRNVVIDLLDGSLGVAYIAPRPRAGQLKMLFDTRAAAFTALTLHAQPCSFTLTSHVTEANMTYAIDGDVSYDQDANLGQWWVTVGYQELT